MRPFEVRQTLDTAWDEVGQLTRLLVGHIGTVSAAAAEAAAEAAARLAEVVPVETADCAELKEELAAMYVLSTVAQTGVVQERGIASGGRECTEKAGLQTHSSYKRTVVCAALCCGIPCGYRSSQVSALNDKLYETEKARVSVQVLLEQSIQDREAEKDAAKIGARGV